MNRENIRPIIRHCANCKWSKTYLESNPWCCVRHNEKFYPRISALFCRFFRKVIEDE